MDLTQIAFELQQEKAKRKRLRAALAMLAKTNFDPKHKLSYEEGVAFHSGVLDVQEAIVAILQENK